MKHALDLLITFVIARPELLEQLYDYEKKNGWIERLLLAAQGRKIRQATSNAMLRLAQQISDESLEKLGTEAPAKHFLEALLSILPGITSYAQTCQQVLFNIQLAFPSTYKLYFPISTSVYYAVCSKMIELVWIRV